MNNFFIFLLAVCSVSYTYANSPILIQGELNWEEEPLIHDPTGKLAKEILSFDGAIYNGLHPRLPYVLETFPLSANSSLSVELTRAEYEPLDRLPKGANAAIIEDEIAMISTVQDQRRQFIGKLTFIPIRRVGNNRYEKLVRYELRIQPQAKLTASPRGINGTFNSVLSDGNIYKIAVENEGIHKITYGFLKDELNIDIDNVDPRTLKLYGNGGGVLPGLNSLERYDDLVENAIQIVGEEDGSFDSGDYILFYGEGPDKRLFNETSRKFDRPKNPFDTRNYYFVKISAGNGLRVQEQSSLSSTTYQTNEFDDYQRFEEERVNLLNEGTGSQGTGQRWFGESFNTTRERSKSFDFPNVLASEGATVKVAMAGRGASSSSFSVQVGDKNVNSTTISSVKVGDSEAVYATIGTAESLFPVESDQISVSISYPPRGSGTNVAWLDYVEVTARRRLAFVSPQMRFQDIRSIAFPSTNFQLATAGSNPTIWDISDPLVPKRQQTQSSGDGLSFGVSSDEQLREFIAFDANADFSAPIAIGSIPNQNLHAIDQVDMLIVYHPEFEEATQKIAEHRRNFSGLQVATANIFDLYNEFSSGSQDPTAIRDMARLLYDRSDKFRFLLLVGDGSYDYKNIYNHAKEGDERNFIPVFETTESLDPILGYPSDDYYAMLSPNEGPSLRGALDLAIGRMTVRTSTEAMNVVDKIIQYDQNPGFLRDWRNRITFVADDEDTNLHVRDADRIAVQIDTTHRVFNINKIYLDAYQQEATPGGARYPQAQQALNRDIFRGALVVNYLGHGGSRGWAQERVLTISDILSWKNQTQLPLLITATCSFTGYDEPTITSAGEESLLNGEGGVIGLFTTVRAVYASSNFRLTRSVFDIIFEDRDMPIGEILMRSKNANSSDNSNARKFTLIGDPAMRLAIPQYSVATTEINGRDISTGFVDTLRALEKVNIKGFVQGDNGQIMSDFNGKVYPTIYDKRIVVSTLGQDERSSPREFEIQRNVIFKGVASVVNGRFAFDFVVPKDIDYNFGLGKISYYAEDGRQNDARGFFENVIIGGASSEKFADDQGPLVEVFMNNEDFIFGGQTDESPTLLVKLSDDNGINVAGNSIGHDLSAVLDNNTQNSYILNDFYQSELDNYTKGEVRFPLFDLEPGKHEIRVKAWDIANNSAEGYTEFIVADSEASALANVLNYPNPFTTSTNFQFEYNQSNQSLDVQVQIFTVSGRLVKTLEDQVFNEGSVMKLPWDGRDDFGDRLARGVYLYRVKVRALGDETASTKTESEFEKLVILK